MIEDFYTCLPQVIAIARAAGKLIMEFYQGKNFTVRLKPDQSPVTDADLAAHYYINDELLRLFPWPVVSEESALLPPAEEQPCTYWLVDPLDGTREFLEATGQFSVNIALIHQGFPVLGIIYAPIFQQLYYASQGHGAFLQLGEAPVEAIYCRSVDSQEVLVIASNRTAPEVLARYRVKLPGCIIMTFGSSLKFCFIAQGKADLYIRRGPTGEWDTAAAQCLVEEAGGTVVDWQSRRLVYGKSNFRNEGFIACGDSAYLQALTVP